jgi:glutathione S-transferase
MLLFDNSWAPNPRRVRIFLAEKGVSIPSRQIDLRKAEHWQAEFTAINALQKLPALELDDGAVLTESVAICRYIEELHPETPLFGRDAREKAFVEMWNRRLELSLMGPIAHVFRHLHPGMRNAEIPQVAAWGEANKPKALAFLDVFDRHLMSNRYAAGDHFSIADITGFVALSMMGSAKLPWPDHIAAVTRWHNEIAARPSMSA